MATRNATISPSEKMICGEIVTNENDSHVVNSDPLFQLFSTELFDPFQKSIEKMLQQFDIVSEWNIWKIWFKINCKSFKKKVYN